MMMQTNRVLNKYFAEMTEAIDKEKSPIDYAYEFADAEVTHWLAILSSVEVVEKIVPYLEKEMLISRDKEHLTDTLDILKSISSMIENNKFDNWTQVATSLVKSFRLHDSDRIWLSKAQRLAKRCRNKKYRRHVEETESVRLKIRNQFVQTNLRLAISICKGSLRRAYNHSFEDLIQEANTGLLKAVERFDPDLGYSFSTYASWWVRHAINRALQDKGQIVRVPVHVHETLASIVKFSESYKAGYGTAPSNEEISKALGITVSKVEYILSAQPRMSHLSLNVSISDDIDDKQWIDTITYTDQKPVDSDTLSEQAHDVLHEAIKTLTPIQSEVLYCRFGFKGDALTLDEIGKMRNLSRERIRQIEAAAIVSLRRHFERTKEDVRFWE